MIEAEISLERKPLVLDFTPKDFDGVEFRTIGRDAVKADALAQPVCHAGLKRAAGVDGGVVEDDEARFPGLGGLGREGIQGSDDGLGVDGASDRLKESWVGGTEKAQNLEAGAGGARNGQGFSSGLPGVRDAGGKRKAALIEVKHVEVGYHLTLFI